MCASLLFQYNVDGPLCLGPPTRATTLAMADSQLEAAECAARTAQRHCDFCGARAWSPPPPGPFSCPLGAPRAAHNVPDLRWPHGRRPPSAVPRGAWQKKTRPRARARATGAKEGAPEAGRGRRQCSCRRARRRHRTRRPGHRGAYGRRGRSHGRRPRAPRLFDVSRLRLMRARRTAPSASSRCAPECARASGWRGCSRGARASGHAPTCSAHSACVRRYPAAAAAARCASGPRAQ